MKHNNLLHFQHRAHFQDDPLVSARGIALGALAGLCFWLALLDLVELWRYLHT